ncbi:hypothetical protein GmHk_10G029227 [Glycine max]|nr:hypothetical protein GmHk_10G029227 [Glycine max]
MENGNGLSPASLASTDLDIDGERQRRLEISLGLQCASYSYAPPHSSHSDIRANLIRFDASKVAKDKHGWIFDPIALALAFGISSGAVTCGSLHMGEIRVGNKRANQRHHICNETFLIWGATTKFRMGRVDGHNPHIRKDLPLTWTNVYEEATNSSVSLSKRKLAFAFS